MKKILSALMIIIFVFAAVWPCMPPGGSDYGDKNIASAGTPLIHGDVDGDGQVTVQDAIMVLRYIVGMVYLNQDQMLRADVDGDGQVNVNDAILILRYIVGIIESFPAAAGDPDHYIPDAPATDTDETFTCSSPCGLSIIANPVSNEFVNPETGDRLFLGRFQIISPQLAYATPHGGRGYEFDLWRITDGGRSCEMVRKVEARNSGIDSALRFYAYADELWYTTWFSRIGRRGTAGVSHDGGKTWSVIESYIQDPLYEGDPIPIASLGRVKNHNRHVLAMGVSRDSWVISSDGGNSWGKYNQPGISGLTMRATDSYMFATGSSDDVDFFLYDFATNTFTGIRDRLPAYFGGRLDRGAIVRVSPYTDTITLTDNSSSDNPPHTIPRSAVYSTDGGETFHTLYRHEQGGDEDGYELEQALALNEHVGFIVEQTRQRTRIRGTCDGGKTWHIIEERRNEASRDIYELRADQEGNAYALWTRQFGMREIMRLTD